MAETSNFKRQIKNFPPAYFALVMATGIISTGCQLLHYDLLSKILFLLNNVQYFILLLVLTVRIILFFAEVKIDLAKHEKGAGFLTFVAASCILAMGYVQGKQLYIPAIVLLTVSLAVWLLLMYSFLFLVILKTEKPTLEKGINGSWLLLIVSTQSLVILVATLAPHLSLPVSITLFASLCGWLLGILLYMILVTIIIYRLTFYPVYADEIDPSYWIDTGAAAITALAGITLSNALSGLAGFQQFIPVIHLLIILLWATATFFLPLLFILETWRHVKTGFAYSPGYWSLVFPLGMYTAATLKLSSIIQIPFLYHIAHVFLFIALVAWLLTFVGMLNKMFRVLFFQ